MQQQETSVSVEETQDSDLLDCYRIAIDFGMSAALKAYEKLTLENQHIIENNNNSG